MEKAKVNKKKINPIVRFKGKERTNSILFAKRGTKKFKKGYKINPHDAGTFLPQAKVPVLERLKNDPKYKEKMEEFIVGIYEGKTLTELGKIVGISAVAVYKWLADEEFQKTFVSLRRAGAISLVPSLIRSAKGEDIQETETITETKTKTGKKKIKKYITRVYPNPASLKLALNSFYPEVFTERTQVDMNTQNVSAVFLIPSSGNGKAVLPSHLQENITEADIKKLKELNPNAIIPDDLIQQLKNRGNGGNGNGSKT